MVLLVPSVLPQMRLAHNSNNNTLYSIYFEDRRGEGWVRVLKFDELHRFMGASLPIGRQKVKFVLSEDQEPKVEPEQSQNDSDIDIMADARRKNILDSTMTMAA
jgi:hypothetical protein